MERKCSRKEAIYDAGPEYSSAFPIQYNLDVFDGFRRFLTVNKQLTGRTVASHLNLIGRFYEEYDGREVTQKGVQEYLMKLGNKNTYRNNLSTLRVFFRDFKQVPWLVEGFRFPRVMLLPKAIPSRVAYMRDAARAPGAGEHYRLYSLGMDCKQHQNLLRVFQAPFRMPVPLPGPP